MLDLNNLSGKTVESLFNSSPVFIRAKKKSLVGANRLIVLTCIALTISVSTVVVMVRFKSMNKPATILDVKTLPTKEEFNKFYEMVDTRLSNMEETLATHISSHHERKLEVERFLDEVKRQKGN